MKERPILFSTPMVHAILRGRKTQTRRIVKDQPFPESKIGEFIIEFSNQWKKYDLIQKIKTSRNPIGYEVVKVWKCPYGKVGDILWVRETWAPFFIDNEDDAPSFRYKANNDDMPKWKPSIFMPRKACRIRLEITNIRVERLQDISEEDVFSEGIEIDVWDQAIVCKDYADDDFFQDWTDDAPKYSKTPARDSYKSLWDKINGKDAWNSNPWVWVIEFKRIEP